ncbi:ABC transporter substrate-binding protein [Spongiactinospora sp. 9N601]|uniref:ABC transporter substrate-binding protein n=1 Tax=Spongiactinospora sp. 9N601 TaxID=3375149 RepID=UPI0037A4983F
MVAPAALVVVLAATGCGSGGGSGGGSATSERPTIRWGVATEGITSMDPVRAVQPTDRSLSMMLFDGLVRYVPNNATAPFEPGIAKEIPKPATEGGKQVWTIALRPGVKCPAGQKTPAYDLTSDDVVFSLKRAADPDKSTFASVFGAYDKVEAVDPATVKVTMKHPVSPIAFLPTISNWQGGLVVCKKAAEAEGEDFGKHPVGPGPFKFEKWTPGQRITLTANDDYYLGKPLAAGWEIRFMSDDTARQAALFGGDLDVAAPTATGDKGLEVIDSRPGFKVVETPLFGTWYLLFNAKTGPTAKPEVRKALAYAVNRADYVASAGKRTSKPTFSVWGDHLPGGIPDAHVQEAGLTYDFDVAKARQMLADAGYPNGFDVTITTPSNATSSQILQAQLKEIGVNVKIKSVDVPTWQTAMMTGQEPLMLTLISYRPTPQIPYTDFFYGPSYVRGGKHPVQNFGGYDGADDLIEKAAVASDSKEQARLWEQINDKILQDAAAKPLYVSYQAYGAVCGFTMGGAEPPVAIPGNWQPSYQATINAQAKDC